MHAIPIAQSLVLLTAANVAPLLAKKWFGSLLAVRLDGGITLFDGRPLFGSTKTLRGIVFAVMATSVCAPIIGLAWHVGFVAGTAAMLGDLAASFVKRRLGFASSSKATGIDQIPESLLPALLLRPFLPLSAIDVVIVTAIFLVGEMISARIFFELHLRDRPY